MLWLPIGGGTESCELFVILLFKPGSCSKLQPLTLRGVVVYVCVCVCLDCAMTYVRLTKLKEAREWVIGLCRSETENENGRKKE